MPVIASPVPSSPTTTSTTTTGKTGIGELIPANAIDGSFSDRQPLLTPEQLKSKFLKGISLQSPETGEAMTDEELSEAILDGCSELALETGLSIFPTQHEERYEFDRNEYQMMGYFRLRQRPVHSVESLKVVTSNDAVLWQVANDWIDTGFLHQGLIYIVPINVAVAQTSGSGGGAGGAAFLAILGQQSWVPAFWRIKYTTGFPDGVMPRVVNTVIGCHTGINILNALAAANARNQSKSLSMDGVSQSNSNAGPDIFKSAIEALTLRKTTLVNRLRTKFGTKIFAGNV